MKKQDTKQGNWVRYLGIYVISFVFFMSLDAYASKTMKFLHGCEEIGHEFQRGKLAFIPVQESEEDQTLYFIHNVSYDRIKIESQKTYTTSLYPIWETTINSDNWAAFAVDRDNITFKCYEDDYGEFTREVNCRDVVEVCQFPRAKFAEHNQGNYWISTNRSKYGTRNEVIRKGVLLKW